MIATADDGPHPIIIRVYEGGALVAEVPMGEMALALHVEQCVAALSSSIRRKPKPA